jgi:hypothetical protein
MMRRSSRTGILWLAMLLVAAPASAQIVQSLHLGAGIFFPRGEGGRASGDVLVEDLITTDPFLFKVSDFRGVSFFGEWNFGLTPRMEVSAGVGYYTKTVTSIYRDLVNGHFTETTADDTEIAQDLSLRMVPFTGIVRFMPVGSAASFQPFVGAGVAVVPFRYSEVGEFVDTTDGTVFPDRYISTRTAVGPVISLGFRIPISGDIYAISTEWRYQWVTGDTGGTAAGFLSDKIDLSGGNLNFGFLIRF